MPFPKVLVLLLYLFVCSFPLSISAMGCFPGYFGPASAKLLLIRADTDNSWASVVKTQLNETGSFGSIDIFDGRAAVPTLLLLQQFDVALVWATGVEFSSASALGDILADYWDGGGAVVIAMFANHRSRIQGRFGDMSNGYLLMDERWSAHDPSSAALGEVSSEFMHIVVILCLSHPARKTRETQHPEPKWASEHPEPKMGERATKWAAGAGWDA